MRQQDRPARRGLGLHQRMQHLRGAASDRQSVGDRSKRQSATEARDTRDQSGGAELLRAGKEQQDAALGWKQDAGIEQ